VIPLHPGRRTASLIKFLSVFLLVCQLTASCQPAGGETAVAADVQEETVSPPVRLKFLGYISEDDTVSWAANSAGLFCNLLTFDPGDQEGLTSLLFFDFVTMQVTFAPQTTAEAAKGGLIVSDDQYLYIFREGSVTRSDMNGLQVRTLVFPEGGTISPGAVIADDSSIYFLCDSDRSTGPDGYFYRASFAENAVEILQVLDTNLGTFRISGIFGQSIVVLLDTGYSRLSLEPLPLDDGDRYVSTTSGMTCMQFTPGDRRLSPFQALWIDDIASFMGGTDYYIDPYTNKAWVINLALRDGVKFTLGRVLCTLGTGDVSSEVFDLTNTVYDRAFDSVTDLFPLAVNEKIFAIPGAPSLVGADYSSEAEIVPTIVLIAKDEYLTANTRLLFFNYDEINVFKKQLTAPKTTR